jgi:MoaA/NifB/PqqE/SkfB family radical SAM enzyme
MNVRTATSLAVPFLGARIFGARTPLVVGIQLTLRCNFRCDYCTRTSDQRIELPFDLVTSLLEEIARLGGRKVVFTGGEPLLYPGVVELARRGHDLGLSVSLNTNGTFLPRQLEILRWVTDLTTSLDGGRVVHDEVRGAGSFDRVIESLRLARQHRIKRRVTVVLHRLSLGSVHELLRIGQSEDVPITFQPVFDPPEDRTDVYPSVDDYRAAIDDLLAAKRGAAREVIANSAEGLAYLRDWPDLSWSRCAGGFLFCRVQVDGDVVICAENKLSAAGGNVLRDGARAFESAFRGLDVLRCGTCPCANHVEINQAFAPHVGAALNLARLV